MYPDLDIFPFRALDNPGPVDVYNGSVAAAETLAHFARAVSDEFRRRMRHSIALIQEEQKEKGEEEKENRPPGPGPQ